MWASVQHYLVSLVIQDTHYIHILYKFLLGNLEEEASLATRKKKWRCAETVSDEH